MRLGRTRLLPLAALLALAALPGCEKALFPEHAPRTQYDRYSMLRGQARPEKVEDALGDDQPALRQRLQPLDRGY